MTTERIDELRRLCDAATPGPWCSCGSSVIPPDEHQGHFDHDPPDWIEWMNNGKNYPNFGNDRDFIAAARTAMPELLADNDRLQRAILSFGNNPAGFDWAVLGKIDEQEQEIERLRAENEQIPSARDMLNRWGRECGVAACIDPYNTLPMAELIDRIWSKVSGELSAIINDEDGHGIRESIDAARVPQGQGTDAETA